MKPLLSEFSYGYALTEELSSGVWGPLIGAPMFPSLFDEGALGYDVQIPFVGAPLFLQFKLSDKLVRNSAAEAADFGIPYFRFYLRPRRHSMQHDLLQNWQASGEDVYYVAPLFHTHAELDTAYTSRTVFASSALFEPLDIDLPDDEEHYVSFSSGASFFVRCSEQKKQIDKGVAGPEVVGRLAARVREKEQKIDQAFFSRLSDRLLGLAKNRTVELDMFESPEFRKDRNEAKRSEAHLAAYLSRSVLGCELLLVRTTEA